MFVFKYRIWGMGAVWICGNRAGSRGVGTMLFWIFLLFVSFVAVRVTSETVARVNEEGYAEYCDTDTFMARCKHGEVIVMQSAKYGRMKFGKCVDKDWGWLGCQIDVMLLADRWCSGRRSCQIPIPNGPFRSLRKCPKDLNNYFEAAFSCIRVETAESQSCMTSKYILPLSPTNGVLANYLTMETKKGSEDCPWVIEARLGQRINITLMDFSRANADHISGQGPVYDVCHVYAVITESSRHARQVNPHTVCGGGQDREKMVYVSKGHTLEVRVIGSLQLMEERRYFLLKYQVYGCETPKPFPNTWIKRKDEDRIVIGCQSGGNRLWHAQCVNNIWHWEESVGNCTEGKNEGAVDVGFVEFLLNVFALPLEYTLVVLIIIALAVLIMGVAIAVCCVKVICPKKKKPPQQQQMINGRHRVRGDRQHDKTKPIQAVQPTTKPNPAKHEVPKPNQKVERHLDMEQGNLGNLPPPPAFLMDLPEKEKECDTMDDEEMPPPPVSPTDQWPIKTPPNMELPPTPGQSPPSYNQLFENNSPRKQNFLGGGAETVDRGRHVKGHRRMPSDATLTLQRSPRGHNKPMRNNSQNLIPMSAGYQTNPHNSFEFPPPPKEFLRQTSEPAQERHRVRFQDLQQQAGGHKRRNKRLSSDPLRDHLNVRDPGQQQLRKYEPGQQSGPSQNDRKDPGGSSPHRVKQPQGYGAFSQQILNARPPTEATLTLDNVTVADPLPTSSPRHHEQTYFELEPDSTADVPYEMGYSVKTGRKFKVFHSDSHQKEKQMLKALEPSPGPGKKKKGISNNTM